MFLLWLVLLGFGLYGYRSFDRRLGAIEARVFSGDRPSLLASPVVPMEQPGEVHRPVPPPPAEGPVSYGPGVAPVQPLREIHWGRLLGYAGALAFLSGVGFFLKLGLNEGIITPAMLVVLGLFVGTAVLLWGVSILRKSDVRPEVSRWGSILSGIGVGVLYLSLFAGHTLYGIIGDMVTYGLVFLVSVAAVAVAVSWSRAALAWIGVLGALGAPILLGTPEGVTAGVLVYELIVVAAVVGLSFVRPLWSGLVLAAVLLTQASVLASVAQWDDTTFGLFWETGFFTVFLLGTLGLSVFREVKASIPVVLALVLATVGYWGSLVALIGANADTTLGSVALALAALFLFVGWVAARRVPEDATMSLVLPLIGLIFTTVGVAYSLSGIWEGIVFLGIAVIVAVLGRSRGIVAMDLVGIPAVLAAGIRVFSDADTLWNDSVRDVLPFLNGGFLLALLPAIAIAGLAWYLLSPLYTTEDGADAATRRGVGIVHVALACFFLYFALWHEAHRLSPFVAALLPVATAGIAAYFAERFRLIPLFTLGVFAGVFGALQVFDAVGNEAVTGSFVAVLNPSFASLFAVAIVAFMTARIGLRLLPNKTIAAGLLIAAHAFFIFGVLSSELDRAYDARIATVWTQYYADVASQASFAPAPNGWEDRAMDGERGAVSVAVEHLRQQNNLFRDILWALSGAVLIGFGFVWRDKVRRYAGMGVIGIALLSLLVTLWDFGLLYRAIVSVSLGVFALLGYFLYARFDGVRSSDARV